MNCEERNEEIPIIADAGAFSAVNEPTLTVNRDRIKFNAACLRALPEADYIHVAVYPIGKSLCAVPVGADEKHVVRWSSYSAAKRGPKEIPCKEFAERLYRLMGWSERNRYKIIGRAADDNGTRIIAFDLVGALCFAPNADGAFPRAPATSDGFGIPADELAAHPLVRRFAEDTEITTGRGCEHEREQ